MVFCRLISIVKMTRKIAIGFLLLFFYGKIVAQTTTTGDSTLVRGIDRYLSSIYDKQDTPLYFLTKKSLQKIPSTGSKVYAERKGRNIQRIGISSMTSKGEFAEEYWFRDSKLIFVYQTFVYFQEFTPLSKITNFQGMRYWESRFYLANEQVQYQITTGIKEKKQNYTTSDLVKQKNRLLKFINHTGL